MRGDALAQIVPARHPPRDTHASKSKHFLARTFRKGNADRRKPDVNAAVFRSPFATWEIIHKGPHLGVFSGVV
jgi:hypothetical protein